MFFKFIVSFLIILISINFLCANAQLTAKGGGFKPVNSSRFASLELELQNSNAYDFLPAGAKIRQIKSAQQQVVAGINFKFTTDVVVNEQSTEYCIEAHRTLQQVFNIKSAKPGPCE